MANRRAWLEIAVITCVAGFVCMCLCSIPTSQVTLSPDQSCAGEGASPSTSARGTHRIDLSVEGIRPGMQRKEVESTWGKPTGRIHSPRLWDEGGPGLWWVYSHNGRTVHVSYEGVPDEIPLTLREQVSYVAGRDLENRGIPIPEEELPRLGAALAPKDRYFHYAFFPFPSTPAPGMVYAGYLNILVNRTGPVRFPCGFASGRCYRLELFLPPRSLRPPSQK